MLLYHEITLDVVLTLRSSTKYDEKEKSTNRRNRMDNSKFRRESCIIVRSLDAEKSAEKWRVWAF